MGISPKTFLVDLYLEHLEEASFLYVQRLVLINSIEVPWRALHDFEERLEAHIDALVIGAELALETCSARAKEGDAGELFAAVCVFCRHKNAPLFGELLKSLDYADPLKVSAVSDALKRELPDEWKEFAGRALANGEPKFALLLARVVGYRRMPLGDVLIPRLTIGNAIAKNDVAWALGRLRFDGAVTALHTHLKSVDDPSRATALLSLLRLGDQEAHRQALSAVPEASWSHLGLGLSGGTPAVRKLVAVLKGPRPDRDCVLALGLLGDLSVVRPLVKFLTIAPLAEAAAEALHIITGAPLFEKQFVPEEIVEDELFEEELKVYKETGNAPTHLDGKPFGSTITALSRNPETWNAWLTQNAAKFQAGVRYRLGQPYGPRVLLACLISDTISKAFRQLTYEELVIRYGADFSFETEMTVVQQLRAMHEMSQWIAVNEGRFAAGRWCFAGRVIE